MRDRLRIGDVGFAQRRSAAFSLDQAHSFVRGLPVAVGDQDLGAFAREQDGGCAAVAPAGADRARAGYERDLVGETPQHPD